MKIRLDLEVDEPQVQKLIQTAYLTGWSREEPRKRWTEKEKKEAARYGLQSIIEREIGRTR